MAQVIPLRRRGATRRAQEPQASGESPYGAHPAGRKLTQRARAAGPGRSDTTQDDGGPAHRDVGRGSEGHAAPDSDPEPEAHEVARTIVLKQLTGAPRSRKQLADTLARRGCDPQVAQEVLDRLEEVGLIDDREFAESYVRSRQTTRGLGRRALAAELRGKGVSSDIVADAVESVDPDAERERAEALVAKKLRSMRGLDAAVRARRLAGMLARKGYPADLAWSVIREAVDEAPDVTGADAPEPD